MKKPSHLTEDERAELVAFLDGELPDESARAVEARINREPAYRAEARAMERAWEMLDFLPRSEPAANFGERTLSRILPLPARPARRPGWFWPAVAGGWAAAFLATVGLTYVTCAWAVPVEPGEADLVRDLRLIEHKKAYDNVEDFEFLRQLEHPDLFGDDAGS